MKHIKLYEGFKNEIGKLAEVYLNKIKDCVLYLSDNYNTKVDILASDVTQRFTVRVRLNKSDYDDELFKNLQYSEDRIKIELDTQLQSYLNVTFLRESDLTSWVPDYASKNIRISKETSTIFTNTTIDLMKRTIARYKKEYDYIQIYFEVL